VVLAIAALGATAGLIGGLSRLGVAGQIVPAALSLVGGVTLYVFFVERERGVIASVVTLAFASALFFRILEGHQFVAFQIIFIFGERTAPKYTQIRKSIQNRHRLIYVLGRFAD